MSQQVELVRPVCHTCVATETPERRLLLQSHLSAGTHTPTDALQGWTGWRGWWETKWVSAAAQISVFLVLTGMDDSGDMVEGAVKNALGIEDKKKDEKKGGFMSFFGGDKDKEKEKEKDGGIFSFGDDDKKKKDDDGGFFSKVFHKHDDDDDEKGQAEEIRV
ncbi:hypothetical protein FQA47_008086 [Oryzias melastigma]|uniref:Uncharacterized protein n=1 Tax=Oryzias melastigma TaxID=30732 RepID=A0A834FES9_ORYME|nr:hypothetical protein FQA47_008086 [Oryzias melastigma]